MVEVITPVRYETNSKGAFIPVENLSTAAKAELDSMMPKPATTAPPAVAETSMMGSQPLYARADHTHQSSMQSKSATLSGSGGTYTWIFDRPYTFPPVVSALVEVPVGTSQPYVVCQLGLATTTQVTFIVFKAAPQTLGTTLLAIAGTVVNLFSPASANEIKLNMLARKAPTA